MVFHPGLGLTLYTRIVQKFAALPVARIEELHDGFPIGPVLSVLNLLVKDGAILRIVTFKGNHSIWIRTLALIGGQGLNRQRFEDASDDDCRRVMLIVS